MDLLFLISHTGSLPSVSSEGERGARARLGTTWYILSIKDGFSTLSLLERAMSTCLASLFSERFNLNILLEREQKKTILGMQLCEKKRPGIVLFFTALPPILTKETIPPQRTTTRHLIHLLDKSEDMSSTKHSIRNCCTCRQSLRQEKNKDNNLCESSGEL